MQFYEYRGFTIYPTPKISLEGDAWTLNLSIRRGANVKAFKTAYSFGTKGEAVFHCINFGKKIVDGDVEDLTVDDIL